jgi:hypothetical protein
MEVYTLAKRCRFRAHNMDLKNGLCANLRRFFKFGLKNE